VRRPDGQPAFTRAGQLQVDANGVLVNAQGLPLVPQITVPNNATAITIGENGMVSATVPGHAAPTELGQLTLTGFVNPAGLLALGENLFQETAASGTPNEGRPGDGAFGKLKQGALEGSNVQVVEEMVDMIAAQRTYEMNTKVLSAADNMLQYLPRLPADHETLRLRRRDGGQLLLAGCASRVPLNNPQPVDDALALPKTRRRAPASGAACSAPIPSR
jgi:flagellar basal-body rod protein FlgG